MSDLTVTSPMGSASSVFPNTSITVSIVVPFPGSHTVRSVCKLSDCLIVFLNH